MYFLVCGFNFFKCACLCFKCVWACVYFCVCVCVTGRVRVQESQNKWDRAHDNTHSRERERKRERESAHVLVPACGCVSHSVCVRTPTCKHSGEYWFCLCVLVWSWKRIPNYKSLFLRFIHWCIKQIWTPICIYVREYAFCFMFVFSCGVESQYQITHVLRVWGSSLCFSYTDTSSQNGENKKTKYKVTVHLEFKSTNIWVNTASNKVFSFLVKTQRVHSWSCRNCR